MRNFNLEKTSNIKLMIFDKDLGRVECKNYEVKFTLSTNTEDIEDIFEAQVDQNVSFSKILYFLENVINDSFVFQKELTTEMCKFVATSFDNNLIVLPSLEENVLVLALHSKMNAIAAENSFVESLEVKDLDLQLNYNYFSDEFDSASPALPTKDDWMGDLAFYDNPWWERNDSCTFDNAAETAEEREKWVALVSSDDYESENLHDQAFECIEEELRSFFKRAKDTKEGKGEAEVIEINFEQEHKKNKKWTPKVV